MNIDSRLVLVIVVVAIVSPLTGFIFLEPTDDTMEDVRRTIIPPVDAAVEEYNDAAGTDYYAECNTTDEQYVGAVSKGERQFEQDLESMGFERNPVACLKDQESTNETEDGSFRLVQGDYQLHVVIYNRGKPDTTYVYAHWEYRWDTHPIKHYDEDEFSESKGISRMRELMDEHNITYRGDAGHPKDL